MSNHTATAPAPRLLVAAAPVAAAIGAFGVVYGAAAQPILGTWLTLASSVIVFSGAAQFTMIALVAAGAAPAGLLGAIAALALRHLPLGAILRPRLQAGRTRRALLAFFLVDETAGLALTVVGPAERTLAVSGVMAYGAWNLGTVAGMAGAGIGSVEPLAAALFPVLFVGLAALTARRRTDVVRAGVAGLGSVVLLVLWPAADAIGVLAIALVVSCLGRRP